MDEQNGQNAMQAIEPSAIEYMQRAEIDVAIATARRFPRSLKMFQQKAATMATLDSDVAGSCFYKLRRRGKDGTKEIEGPSVRFAEIVAASYGNLRFGARVVEIGERWITAQGVCHDLENNVQTTTEVRRRITDSTGRRYNEDMVAMTANAACSIALRNAIFKAVPFSLAKSVYDQAKKTAIGDAKTLAERRQKMMQAFNAMGVAPQKVFARWNIKGVEDIDLSIYEEALGVFTAIKDGDASVDDEFPAEKATEQQPAKAAESNVAANSISDSAAHDVKPQKESASSGLASAAASNGKKEGGKK